jgi:hypothetical protein
VKVTVANVEVFTAVKIQVEVLRVVTPYRVVVGYRRFGGPVASIFRLDL